MEEDDYIGTIKLFAGKNIPFGWMTCQGQSLNTHAYGALFNLLGYKYGGSGNTFNLPDYQGRVIVGSGTSSSSKTVYAIGQTGGYEQGTVTMANMPAHKHPVTGSVTMLGNSQPGDEESPEDAFYANADAYNNDSDGAGYMGVWQNLDLPSDASGGGEPYDNMQPYMALNHIICHFGVYPSSELVMEDVAGMIIPFAGTTVPDGWELCDGASYEIDAYRELFGLIGTTYGGSGTTFNVPNLMGRAAIGTEAGATAGVQSGSEKVTLNLSHIMNHGHDVSGNLQMACNTLGGDTSDPDGTFPAPFPDRYSSDALVNMGDFNYQPACLAAGANTPTALDNRNPYQALQYIICCQGDFAWNPDD